jgi:hypothetical protein
VHQLAHVAATSTHAQKPGLYERLQIVALRAQPCIDRGVVFHGGWETQKVVHGWHSGTRFEAITSLRVRDECVLSRQFCGPKKTRVEHLIVDRRTSWVLALVSSCIIACGGHTATSGTTWRATDAAVPPTYTYSPIKQNKVSKIDLLFMIDNSSSMADKQAILAQAVPDLINRLVDPVCIDRMTGQQVGTRLPDGSCAQGEPDFDPVKDLHIGIITSSLGGHGTTGVCDDPDPRKTLPHNDDHGHLVARDAMDMPVPTFMNQGFLNWNPTGTMSNQTPAEIATPFATMVSGVGQHGCGYEASLEAIYHFLIDPDPYQTIVVTNSNVTNPGVASPSGTDMTLLQQRSDFLRPDSLVAVIMMTDENDCSIVDSGQGFYSIIPASGAPAVSILGHGTTACLLNPNDPCCYNCFQPQNPACPDKNQDPECQAGPWTRDKDPENLRCWHQKERYGVDFLYSVQRYINGFTNDMVPDRAGEAVKNPLFSDLSAQCRTTNQGCAGERDKSLVFVAGVVGVPWQDIAVDATDLTKGYLTATQISDMGVWQKILGDPSASPPIAPTDPHMLESITPRQGIPGPGSAANADPFNGHDWDPSMANPTPNADLQYACTFALSTPKMCTEQVDCDCFFPAGSNPAAASNPLCQSATGYSTAQVRAKGYPGIRELQVLQGLGDQAVVASICPSNLTNATAADYGYRPAIAALVGRMRSELRGRCLPRELQVLDDGGVACTIIEAFNPMPGAACNCADLPGRADVDPTLITPEVRSQGSCFCEIVQLDGADRTACETFVSPPGNVKSGWCYVDPAQKQNPAECPVVATCPPDDQRTIRFVNPSSEPRDGAIAFLACLRPTTVLPPPNQQVCP